MTERTLSALYGLKWNPLLEGIPVEALRETPRLKHFAWRIEDLVMHGGFALVTGDVGAGKSAALRMLSQKLAPLREVIVGEVTRPQSRVTDFYREIGDLFGVPVSTSNRWGTYKTVRAKWQEHIQQTLFRPVLLIDEAQEMSPLLLAELRLLGSTKLDTCTIVRHRGVRVGLPRASAHQLPEHRLSLAGSRRPSPSPERWARTTRMWTLPRRRHPCPWRVRHKTDQSAAWRSSDNNLEAYRDHSAGSHGFGTEQPR